MSAPGKDGQVRWSKTQKQKKSHKSLFRPQGPWVPMASPSPAQQRSGRSRLPGRWPSSRHRSGYKAYFLLFYFKYIFYFQVDEVIGIMHKNVENVLERDRKLGDLEERADALQDGCAQFEKQAAAMKNKFWMENLKAIIAGSVVGLIVLGE